MNDKTTPDLVALCIRPPGRDINELIAAECEQLTGGRPDGDGVALCRTITHIPHAAYVRMGLRRIAQAPTFDGLLDAIQGAHFDGTDFRVDCLTLSGTFPHSEIRTIVEVANRIPFYPNLETPQHRFLVVAQTGAFWCGEILTETAQSYVPHSAKPYHVSSSLPARMARALVNLVAPPATSLIDPCCGTGSILIEAHALGLQTYGADNNPKIAGMGRKNLTHFNYAPTIDYADARSWTRTADALVTDLPYGKRLLSADAIIPSILAHARTLAPVAVYVAGRNIHAWLANAGYDDIAVYRIIKHNGFTRYVHHARSLHSPPPAETC